MELAVGDIIHIFVNDTKPPKNKFVVILGIDGDKVELLTVFINKSINTNIYKTQYQQGLCYKIYQSDYSFLAFDSFIDLNHTVTRPKNDLDWVLNNRATAKKATLTPDHLKEIRELIHLNRTIKGKDCKKFGFFL